MSQDSESDGFFAGLQALENEGANTLDSSDYTQNNLDTSNSSNSEPKHISPIISTQKSKTKSNLLSKPIKFNKLIPDSSQSSDETVEDDDEVTKENIDPGDLNHGAGFRFKRRSLDLNETGETDEENAFKNEQHRSEKAHINHLNSFKCADTTHVQPVLKTVKLLTSLHPSNFLNSTPITKTDQAQIINMLNNRILKDKEQDFSQQIILNKLSKTPVISSSRLESQKSVDSQDSQESEKSQEPQESVESNTANSVRRRNEIFTSLETWDNSTLEAVKQLEKTAVSELNKNGKVSADTVESYRDVRKMVPELTYVLNKIVKKCGK